MTSALETKITRVGNRVILKAQKPYEVYARDSRHLGVTPHVAQNDRRRGGSAIDERTTRHESYRISQVKRKRIEECFGWLKTIALLRNKVRHRGIFKVDWVFAFACAAYNLVRMRNLTTAPAGMKAHHAYRGGLLEHVVNML